MLKHYLRYDSAVAPFFYLEIGTARLDRNMPDDVQIHLKDLTHYATPSTSENAHSLAGQILRAEEPHTSSEPDISAAHAGQRVLGFI